GVRREGGQEAAGPEALMATPSSDRIAEEQAALRRVATLVARVAAPDEVFAAVAEEAGRVLDVDFVCMHRYDPGRVATAIGVSSSFGPFRRVGSWWRLGGRNVAALVFQTHRPARIDDLKTASGAPAKAVRTFGIRSTVGVPVSVEGRLWGLMSVGSAREPLPAGTEARLAGFTELVATAIANAQARMELRRFADEQAALRRVATLVARAAPPEEVFTAVTEEAGRLLGGSLATLSRYDPDGAIRVIAMWNSVGAAFSIVGTRWGLGGRNMHTLVFQTHRPARIDDYASASGPIAEVVREVGHPAAVGGPISIEGRLWGLIVVGSRAEPLPAGTEARLAGFTELAATAIANAEAQAELTASRARLVATADATRRRFERDLHDRAQQRLVSIAPQLRAAQAAAPAQATA